MLSYIAVGLDKMQVFFQLCIIVCTLHLLKKYTSLILMHLKEKKIYLVDKRSL
jgi:hypothetical protein